MSLGQEMPPVAWLAVIAGLALLIGGWLGLFRVPVIGPWFLLLGLLLCIGGPAFLARGWRSAAIGIGAAVFGILGFPLLINAVVWAAPLAT